MPHVVPFLLLAAALAVPAAAQTEDLPVVPEADGLPAPFHVVAIDGDVTLTRNGENEPAVVSMPLIDGDRLDASRGRIEIADAGHGAFFLDDGSVLDVIGDRAVRLLSGRARLVIGASPDGTTLRVDSPNAVVWLLGAGDYAVEVSVGPRGDTTMVAVLDGIAEVATERGRRRVPAGQQLAAVGIAPPGPTTATSLSQDAFALWIADRLAAQQPTETSTYLPEPLARYGATLEHHGSWEPDVEYGQVWYPVVPAGWRPYSAGYWSVAGRFGYVWIEPSPWVWPTHHYGRWGWRHDRWFWIPGRTWAPAWVAWGIGPGYVGWCPLGWDNRPVFALSSGSVTYFRGGRDRYRRWDGYAARHAYEPHDGWTVLPAQHFRPRVAVARHATDWRRIPAGTRAAFVTQRVPPRRSTLAATRTAPGGGSRPARWTPPPTHYGNPRADAPAANVPAPRARARDGVIGGGGLTVAAPSRAAAPVRTSPVPRRAPDGSSRRGGYVVGGAPRAAEPGGGAAPIVVRPGRSPQGAPSRGGAVAPGTTPSRRGNAGVIGGDRPGYQAPRGSVGRPPARQAPPRVTSDRGGHGHAATRSVGAAPPRQVQRSAPPARVAPPSRAGSASGAAGAGGSAPRTAVPRSRPPSR